MDGGIEVIDPLAATRAFPLGKGESNLLPTTYRLRLMADTL